MFGRSRGGGFRFSPQILIAVLVAGFALCKYYGNTSLNEITGEKQHVALSKDEEIAMGLQSAPEMAAEFGGLSNNSEATALVKRVGERVVANSAAANSGYKYDFHLLADRQTVNAFALPGGQIFITEALLGQLQNEDQLAGVLGHEVGHVVARHSAERLAQMELAQGLTGAVSMATYDPSNPNSAYLAQVVANMITLKYGREQELESDDLGVRFMMETGYKPEELIGVMDILAKASGPSEVPEFQSTHPAPENRAQRIREAIAKYKGQ